MFNIDLNDADTKRKIFSFIWITFILMCSAGLIKAISQPDASAQKVIEQNELSK